MMVTQANAIANAFFETFVLGTASLSLYGPAFFSTSSSLAGVAIVSLLIALIGCLLARLVGFSRRFCRLFVGCGCVGWQCVARERRRRGGGERKKFAR